MIVPMKKISIIVQSKDADSAISRLRALGLLHVENQQAPKGKDINALLEDIALVNSTTEVLYETKFSQELKVPEDREISDWRFVSRHIIDLGKRFNQLEEYSINLIDQISDWQAWGDFDPEEIKRLSEKNIFVRLYQIPVKELKDVPSSVMLKKISTLRGIANCVVISREKTGIPFKEVVLPRTSLQKMKARISEDSRMMDAIKTEIRRHFCYKQSFERVKKEMEKELEFHQVLRGMGESGNIMYLTGFAPIDALEKLRQAAL